MYKALHMIVLWCFICYSFTSLADDRFGNTDLPPLYRGTTHPLTPEEAVNILNEDIVDPSLQLSRRSRTHVADGHDPNAALNRVHNTNLQRSPERFEHGLYEHTGQPWGGPGRAGSRGGRHGTHPGGDTFVSTTSNPDVARRLIRSGGIVAEIDPNSVGSRTVNASKFASLYEEYEEQETSISGGLRGRDLKNITIHDQSGNPTYSVERSGPGKFTIRDLQSGTTRSVTTPGALRNVLNNVGNALRERFGPAATGRLVTSGGALRGAVGEATGLSALAAGAHAALPWAQAVGAQALADLGAAATATAAASAAAIVGLAALAIALESNPDTNFRAFLESLENNDIDFNTAVKNIGLDPADMDPAVRREMLRELIGLEPGGDPNDPSTWELEGLTAENMEFDENGNAVFVGRFSGGGGGGGAGGACDCGPACDARMITQDPCVCDFGSQLPPCPPKNPPPPPPPPPPGAGVGIVFLPLPQDLSEQGQESADIDCTYFDPRCEQKYKR